MSTLVIFLLIPVILGLISGSVFLLVLREVIPVGTRKAIIKLWVLSVYIAGGTTIFLLAGLNFNDDYGWAIFGFSLFFLGTLSLLRLITLKKGAVAENKATKFYSKHPRISAFINQVSSAFR